MDYARCWPKNVPERNRIKPIVFHWWKLNSGENRENNDQLRLRKNSFIGSSFQVISFWFDTSLSLSRSQVGILYPPRTHKGQCFRSFKDHYLLLLRWTMENEALLSHESLDFCSSQDSKIPQLNVSTIMRTQSFKAADAYLCVSWKQHNNKYRSSPLRETGTLIFPRISDSLECRSFLFRIILKGYRGRFPSSIRYIVRQLQFIQIFPYIPEGSAMIGIRVPGNDNLFQKRRVLFSAAEDTFIWILQRKRVRTNTWPDKKHYSRQDLIRTGKGPPG